MKLEKSEYAKSRIGIRPPKTGDINPIIIIAGYYKIFLFYFVNRTLYYTFQVNPLYYIFLNWLEFSMTRT